MGERERERKRDRQTDRQIDRQSDRQTDRYREKMVMTVIIKAMCNFQPFFLIMTTTASKEIKMTMKNKPYYFSLSK